MIDNKNIQLEDLPEEYREVAEIIGFKAALDLVFGFQGCQLYVPKLKTITRQRQYRQMYNDFEACGSYKRVAIKYDLSESHTRQIIKEEKLRRFPPKAVQANLF